jgi:hypothetical protein
VTTRRRLAPCLLICCVLALAAAGAGLAAAKPSPQKLWELYPLDPTGRGSGKQPTTTTQTPDQPSPRGGVAGVGTTKREGTGPTGATVAADDRSRDVGAAVFVGLMLGGLAAAILMLAVATLPESVIPRLGGSLADHRLEMALAGSLALLVITVVYVSRGV